jgi:hypothetical protein
MTELRDVREVVHKALTDHGIEAVVYEANIGARPDTVVYTSLSEVQESDVYVGLFWMKYGDITIQEYRHARKLNKHCFIYVRDKNLRRDRALEDFLQREVYDPYTGVTYSYFESALQLGNAVAKDIMDWLERRYRELSAQINAAAVPVEELDRLRTNLSYLQAVSNKPLPQGDTLDNLARQLREWFLAIGYGLERDVHRFDGHAEMVVKISRRRSGYNRILVRAMDGEIEVSDVHTLKNAIDEHAFDQGWLVSERRVSKAARKETEKHDNLFVYTLDELIDEEVNWDRYFSWLEEEVKTKGIDRYYVHLAGTVDDFDIKGRELGSSRYEKLDDYFQRWLDDPSKEHVSILGEFGTGKTWFTLHFAYQMLNEYRKAKEKGLKRPRVPLVIRLRNYAQGFKDVGALLTEFIFREHGIRLPNYSAFDQLNRMGRLLLIFDGFDEMAARVDRQKMVNNFWELAKVVAPGSKAILTCRTEHFHFAQQERDVLGAKLKASTSNITLEPPKFEVLHLEMLDPGRIHEILRRRTDTSTSKLIVSNPQLLDMARRPVLIEFILEALPEVEAGKPVSMAHIYYYAIQRKMERDIKEERTFTSLADKLYFLCELSWEMFNTDQMSLSYKLFPEHIQRYFGRKVAEVEEDHWHYDLLGQTMLVRDADGNYTPAHRSMLEFFVAYKFAAEMGVLRDDFVTAARKQLGISDSKAAQDYTWSTYFMQSGDQNEQQTIRPLRNFIREPMEQLVKTVGARQLTLAVLAMLDNIAVSEKLSDIIEATRDLNVEAVGYVGGNIATMINRSRTSFSERDLSRTVLIGADLKYAYLNKANLRGANLTSSNLRGASMRYTDFRETNVSGSTMSDLPPRFISWRPDGRYLVSCGNCDGIRVWKTDSWQEEEVPHSNAGMIEAISWSYDGKWLASGGIDCKVRIWDAQTWQVKAVLPGHDTTITAIVWDPNGSFVATGDIQGGIRLWNVDNGEIVRRLVNVPNIAAMQFNTSGTHLAIACGLITRLYVWEFESDLIAHREIGHFLSHYKHYGFELQKLDLKSVKRYGFPEWVPYQRSVVFAPDAGHVVILGEDFAIIRKVDSKQNQLGEQVKELVSQHRNCEGMLIKNMYGLDDTTRQYLLSHGANDTYDGSLANWLKEQHVS